MESVKSEKARRESMKVVNDLIDVLIQPFPFPARTLEEYHQILDTTKDFLTLLSMKGHNGIETTDKKGS